MPSFVELRFRGLRLAEKARFEETPEGGFLEYEAPLPVGSSLALVFPEGGKLAKVVGVVEQEASSPSPPGMKVAWDAVPVPIDAQDSGPVEAEGEETADATQDATPGARKRRGKKKNVPGR